MEKITLPGSWPGLLHKCSPAICKFIGDGFVQEVKNNWALFISDHTYPMRVPIDELELDLADPTGRQHAIWWLTKDKKDKYKTFSFYPGMKAYNKDGSDAYKYWSLSCGWQSIRYWDCENDELDEIGPSDLNIVVESLKDVDWENDTEALRQICLHVAKEKGLL